MIKLTGHLVCATLDEAELIQHYLPEHVRLTREETGCISFAVTQTTNPLIWTVEELFNDQASFDSHQKRTQASEWGSKTRTIVRDYAIFDVA